MNEIKKYKFVNEEKAIYEISTKEINKIHDYLSDVNKLSFNEIFNGKKRIIFPFHSTAKSDISEFIDFFEKNGYKLDFSTGLAEKEEEIPEGPKKGEKKQKKERIGGLLQKTTELLDSVNKLQRSTKPEDEKELDKKFNQLKRLYPFTIKRSVSFDDFFTRISKDLEEKIKKYIDFWNKKSRYYRENPQAAKEENKEAKFSIIISRHPIDVLRMSDFENIQSCHSVGGAYYDCAIAEARGQGLVAYVVDNSYLPDNFDLNKDEIFADARRDIAGIVPISRLRIRKFTDNQEHELPVPETRVYGKKIPGFYEAVLKWSREQKSVKDLKNRIDSGDEDFNIKDFTRYGGSYSDTSDGSMLNLLLDVDHFSSSGRAVLSDTEENFEGEEQAEQWREECEDIKDYFENKLHHSSLYYEVIDDFGQMPYVSYSGDISFTFKDEEALRDFHNFTIGDEFKNIKKKYYEKIKKKGKGVFSSLDLSYEGGDDRIIMGQFNTKDADLTPDGFRDFEDADLTPDGFRDFAEFVHEVDAQYNAIILILKEVLAEEGYIKTPLFSQLSKNIEDEDLEFDNFDIDYNSRDGEISIATHTPIYITTKLYDASINKTTLSKRNMVLEKEYKDKFIDVLYDEYSKKYSSSPEQLTIPGIEPEQKKKLFSKKDLKDFGLWTLESDELPFYGKKPPSGYNVVKFEFTLTPDSTNDSLNTAIGFVKYFDDHYNVLANIAQKVFDQTLKEKGFFDIRITKEFINWWSFKPFIFDKVKNNAFLKSLFEKIIFENPLIQQLLEVTIFYSMVAIEDNKRNFVVLNLVNYQQFNILEHENFKYSVNKWNEKNAKEYNGFEYESILKQSDFFYDAFFKALMAYIKGAAKRHSCDYVSLNLPNALNKPLIYFINIFKKVMQQNGFKQQEVDFEHSYWRQIDKEYTDNVISFWRASVVDLKENKKYINQIVENLFKNKKIKELVKKLEPLDMVDILNKDFSLSPKDASKVVLGLLKKEWSITGIETNKAYPVPNKILFKNLGNNDEDDIDVDTINKPKDKNATHIDEIGPGTKIDVTPRYNVLKYQFVPGYDQGPNDWPYDDMNVQGMDVKNKSHKRPLMNGKNPFIPDPKSDPYGADSSRGFTRGYAKDNSTSVGGQYNTMGYDYWSRAAKEFDLPIDDDSSAEKTKRYKFKEEIEDDKPSFLKDPLVGASAINIGQGCGLGFGGRSQQRRMGRRRR